MNSEKNFYVLKSSAGSGKTYALVKYYLRLALQTENPSYYKQILAITFTNAAAKEMKERVISRLRDFSDDNKVPLKEKPLFEELQQELGIPAHELAHRASQCLVHMLHNYGMIGISTIDSFTHKIVRSFARDLRLHPDFSIEMDTRAFAQKIVDQCLDTVGTDEDLTAYLQQFTFENFEDEKGMRVRQALEDVSMQLFNEDAQDILPILSEFSLQDFQDIRDRAKTALQKFEASIIAPAQKAVDLINNHQLFPANFPHKGQGNANVFFNLAQGVIARPSKRFANDDDGVNRWTTKSGDKAITATIKVIEEDLETLRTEIMTIFNHKSFKTYLLRKEVYKVIYSMGMLARLSQIGIALKEEENTLLISDFHTIISEIVKDSPAPFIYERIGERFNHILFDEFQDTSGLQWNNFLPLIENTLSKGHFNLIVGDGKQAIYRWRNGKAEQFVALPELLGPQLPERRQALAHAYEKGVLSHNYRSNRTIIRFNNSLFGFLKEKPNFSFIKDVYEDHEQEVVHDEEGYAEVAFLEAKKNQGSTASGEEHNEEENVDQEFIQLIVKKVKEALADGYRPGDIAILTRRAGKEAGPIANALFQEKIEVVTKESFLLQNSAKVRLIMAMMRFTIQPDHLYSGISIWQNLAILLPEKYDLKTLVEKYSTTQRHTVVPNIDAFLEAEYPQALLIGQVRSSLEMAESIIRCFQLEKDAFVEFLLDHLTRLSSQRDYSLQETIQWWEDNQEKLYTSTQESTDKVNIMTIHKSKGLQFPVVIYPRFYAAQNERKFWASMNEEEFGISKILLGTKSGKLDGEYADEFYHEIEQFNLDNINLMYVATTRAEDRLYVILDKTKDDLSKSVLEFANAQLEAKGEVFSLGEKKTSKLNPTQPEKAIPINGSFKPNIHSVQLRYTYLKENQAADQQQRLLGSIIHECLSFILVPADIQFALTQIKPRYAAIQDFQWAEIATQLLEITEHPGFRPWFTAGLRLMNEQEIILPSGHPIRPDRIITYDSHWEIVDFKTGARSKKHFEQVKNYMDQAAIISGKPVKGYLLYTSEKEVVAVE